MPWPAIRLACKAGCQRTGAAGMGIPKNPNRAYGRPRFACCIPIERSEIIAQYYWEAIGGDMAGKTDVWQGTLALMVLKTLETLGPLHGYGIARRIEQTSGDL